MRKPERSRASFLEIGETPADSAPAQDFPQLVALATMFEADLREGGKGELPDEELKKLEHTANAKVLTQLEYFAGKYLCNQGHEAKAIECWKRCLAVPRIFDPFRTLAGHELLLRKLGPESYKELLQRPLEKPLAQADAMLCPSLPSISLLPKTAK
jgi:hypothetical protein